MTQRSSSGAEASSAGARMEPFFRLTDDQWFLISHLFPNKPRSSEGGRDEVDNRVCFEGVLWVLLTGARWQDVPDEYSSGSTCWRRFRKWTRDGSFLRAWAILLDLLERLGQIDLSTLMGDGTFCPAKKGG